MRYTGSSLVLLLVAAGCGLTADPDAGADARADLASGERVAVSQSVAASAARPEGWDDYWYSGLAEISTYDFTQVRYRAPRKGEAVLVFVTEPFLPEAQVKDDGRPSGEESISVLKLNRIHRFRTGIYDYSLMLSAFTPVGRDRFPQTLKTTLSSQDWCGHSWFQLNREGGGTYASSRRSYFQGEADADERLREVELLEDELPALVRLDPELVPTGAVRAVPGAMFSSMQHVMPAALDATVRVERGGGVLEVAIAYPELERELTYRFAEVFPHELLGWRETVAGELLSEASRRTTRRSAYWGENAPRFAPLRDSLRL